MILRDGWRLALGTLTRIPVAPPGTVDRRVAGVAMTLAPLAAVPLGALVGAVGLLGAAAHWPPLVRGLLMVGALAWGTRLLHLDGLSDTVDGLTASTERERSLEVMRSGTAGPAGVVALTVVLGIQAVTFGILSATWHGAVLAGAAVVLSRVALTVLCVRGVPAARPGGLGAAVAGAVPVAVAAVAWLIATVAFFAIALVVGRESWWWLAPVGVLAAAGGWLKVCATRLGGITGDVLGAVVETALVLVLLSVV